MLLRDKIRWRFEKYILDPVANFYLQRRFLDSHDTQAQTRVFSLSKCGFKGLPIKYSFQDVLTSFGGENSFDFDFQKAFDRGMKNEPYYERELLRYRVYFNASIAKLALMGTGDFCTVGVSWGVVPRTVFEYTRLQDTGKKYYLIDRWNKNFDASGSRTIDNYCSDFEWIKSEFKEKNFYLIRDFAPAGCYEISSPISYLHLNTADTQSEIATLDFLWDTITTPGFIVIDNYASAGKEQFDAFFKRKNSFVISLLNRQGYVIKLG